MNKLIFRCSSIISYIKKSSLLSIVVTLTILISLFFQCVLLSSLNYNMRDSKIISEKSKEDFLLVNFYMENKSNDEIKNLISSKFPQFNKVGLSSLLLRSTVFFNDEYNLLNLNAVDDSILTMSNHLVSGRLPNENEFETGGLVALLSLRTSLQKNIGLGDSIFFNGQELKVIGTYVEGGLTGDIIIPNSTLDKIATGSSINYELYLLKDDTTDIDSVKNQFNTLFPEAKNIRFENSFDRYSQIDSSIDSSNTIVGFQSLVMFILCTSSIFLVSIGRLFQMRNIFATKMALGSSRLQIIVDCFIENFIFTFIALIINLLIIYFFQNQISHIFLVLFSLELIVNSFIFTLGMSLFVGIISGFIASNSPVSNLMKG